VHIRNTGKYTDNSNAIIFNAENCVCLEPCHCLFLTLFDISFLN
jgi:hypothetical protein